MRTFLRLALALAMMGAAATTAAAQADFGSIKGYVTDESGAALPGVTITVTSVALQGDRSVVTDSEGFYRILSLPPGEYALTAGLSGFSKLERPAITMRAGLNLAVDLKMKIGQVAEVVQVTAEAPLLEAEKTDRRINVDGDFLRALPLSPGHNWWDALKVVPGLLILGGTGGTFESRGAGLSSNISTLDGIEISDVQQNAAQGTSFSPDAIADIRISTSGQDASSRMAVGANLSMVTQSGSNSLAGAFTTDLQPKKLNDTNVPGGSPADQTIYQYSASVGGPVLRDRLWYFGSYRYLSQKFGIARTAAAIASLKAIVPSFEPYDRSLPMHETLIKGTYQITPSDQVTGTYQYNRQDLKNNGNDPTWTQERALGQYTGGPLYAITYQRLFGSRASLQAQAGGYTKPFEVQPQGEGPNVIYYNAAILNGGNLVGSGAALANTGNVQSVNRSEQRRANVNVDFTLFADKLAGSHEFKAGLNATPLHEYTFVGTSSNDGFVLEDRVLLTAGNPAGGSRPFRRRYEDPIRLAGVGKGAQNYGLYFQDSWRPGKRWVLNLGMRFDKAETFDTWGDPIQSSWQGGPRLGATYRVTEDGRNIVRASYNKMYDSTNLLFAFSEGSLRKGFIDRYDIDGDGVFEREVVFQTANLTRPQPAANANRGIVDQNLRQPRTDEFTAGYSRQLPWKLTGDVTFIYREYLDRYVAYDTNGIYENGQFLGYRDPAFNQIFEVTNGTANWFVYKGVDFIVHKSLSNDLQFLAGYSYSNLGLRGTWDPNDPASILQPSTFENNKGVGRTVAPASAQVTSYGLGNAGTGTPPHSFRLNATYIAPYEITVGFSYLYQMGQWSGPIMTLIPQSQSPHPLNVTLSNGRVVTNPLATRNRFYYPTRDEGQITAPALSEVNLRVGKRFTWKGNTLETAVQTFNLLNRGKDLIFNTPTLVEGQPGIPTLRSTQAPRSGQITLRFAF